MKAPALGWQLALAFVLSLLFLVGLISWLQNVHVLTSNGMYKAIQAEPWIYDFAYARLDSSNYLYFPLYGLLAQLLDALGILPGVAWKQFAYLNAFWASVAVVFVYAFFHRLTGSVAAASLAALFHFGCGYFLILGAINEDIMPGYALVLGAMVLAGLWFDRPTHVRVIAVGVLFTLGWLVEWRLIFPTLPALVLALAIADAPWRRRLAWIGTLIVAVVATAGIVQQIWEGHNGAVGLHDLLWTGKGVDSGWGGASWSKAWLMLSGVGNYFLTTGIYYDVGAARQAMPELSLSVLLQLAILAACVVLLWPRRGDRRLRAIAAVFIGTLGAGQVLNFYSQPQDPQMQINVMPWLTVAWGLLVAAVLARLAGPGVRRRVWLGLALLSLAPLAWNVWWLSESRGGDRDMLAAMHKLEHSFPSDTTVFLYWGFEPMVTWQFALWSHTWDWDYDPPPPGPAPQVKPRFKWIAVDSGAIRHSSWTTEQHVAALKEQIELAFRLGYRVAVSDVWNWNVEELGHQLGTLSATDRAPAIHAMLHDTYEARPVLTDTKAGSYYELRPHNGP